MTTIFVRKSRRQVYEEEYENDSGSGEEPSSGVTVTVGEEFEFFGVQFGYSVDTLSTGSPFGSIDPDPYNVNGIALRRIFFDNATGAGSDYFRVRLNTEVLQTHFTSVEIARPGGTTTFETASADIFAASGGISEWSWLYTPGANDWGGEVGSDFLCTFTV